MEKIPITPETPSLHSKPGTILAFDYGRKRIGVATGQELTCTASALTTLHAVQNKPDWHEINKLIETWKPDALVIGVPYHMDGSEQDITRSARKFGRQLHERFQITVYEMDERLSSREAEDRILEQRADGRRKKSKKEDIDKLAAQIILQDWLEQNSRT